MDDSALDAALGSIDAKVRAAGALLTVSEAPSPRRRQPIHPARDERAAILALVDDLASLAADLWFAGKLERLPPEDDRAEDLDA